MLIGEERRTSQKLEKGMSNIQKKGERGSLTSLKRERARFFSPPSARPAPEEEWGDPSFIALTKNGEEGKSFDTI